MKGKSVQNAGPSGMIYILGFLGALVYYISTASNVGEGLFGIIQAILWPAFLVYELMHHIGM